MLLEGGGTSLTRHLNKEGETEDKVVIGKVAVTHFSQEGAVCSIFLGSSVTLVLSVPPRQS